MCGVKPHVLRYWEQEFTQLRPMKRRGNRRYYQHHEVLLIRRIRDLLYEQGFTINGARHRLDTEPEVPQIQLPQNGDGRASALAHETLNITGLSMAEIRQELEQILELLGQAE